MWVLWRDGSLKGSVGGVKNKINITQKKKIQTTIPYSNKENSAETPTAGTTRNQDCGSGRTPKEIEEDQVLRLLSKNPRGFNFTPGNDSKTNTRIEYLRDMQTGIFVTQETNADWNQSKLNETLKKKLTK